MRADKGDLDVRVDVLDPLHQPDISGKPGSARVEDQELVITSDLDRVFCGDVVGWGIEKARTLQHSGRVSQPDGVPVGLNLAGRGPTRTRPAIEVLKRWWIQKQCF